jgi:hypothetical protein
MDGTRLMFRSPFLKFMIRRTSKSPTVNQGKFHFNFRTFIA